MTALFDIVAKAMREEAARIELELERYVGTGLDLGVVRSTEYKTRDNSMEMATSLTFFPVLPGYMPPIGCVVYRVSSLGGFAQA